MPREIGRAKRNKLNTRAQRIRTANDRDVEAICVKIVVRRMVHERSRGGRVPTEQAIKYVSKETYLPLRKVRSIARHVGSFFPLRPRNRRHGFRLTTTQKQLILRHAICSNKTPLTMFELTANMRKKAVDLALATGDPLKWTPSRQLAFPNLRCYFECSQ